MRAEGRKSPSKSCSCTINNPYVFLVREAEIVPMLIYFEQYNYMEKYRKVAKFNFAEGIFYVELIGENVRGLV